MVDEDVAPSRAEIEAWLWSYKRHKIKHDALKDDLRDFLKERGVSNPGISKVISDIQTYNNYPVGG